MSSAGKRALGCVTWPAGRLRPVYVFHDITSRQAGFPLGAKQAISGSHFGSGSGEILLDELDCKTGREDGIQECSFDPWKKHDCSEGEWAGVVCKVEQDSCKEDDEFRCGHNIN